MKKSLLFLAAAFFAFGLVTSANAATGDLNDRLRGYFVLSVEQNGELYYLYPETGNSSYVANPAETWYLIKNQMTGITNADLYTIPRSSADSATQSGLALRDRFLGKFLLAVESHGEVWYVSPKDGFRHYLGTGETTFDNVKYLALGVNLQNLQLILGNISQPVNPAPVSTTTVSKDDFLIYPAKDAADQTVYLNTSAIQAALDNVAYTDAATGWEFASTLWSAYEQYNRDFTNYPEIRWFESGLKWNSKISFDKTGFTLNPGENVTYWEWDNMSLEFFKMFYKNFEMQTPGDGTAVMKFTLPGAVQTPQYGLLPAGTYYFSTGHGFLTQDQFNNVSKLEQKAEEEGQGTLVDLDQIKASLETVDYTDAQMGWDFANSLWNGYQTYNEKFHNYPEKTWFEEGLKWNLPIYFDDTGFTLDKREGQYWEWTNFSTEFYKMYFENFDMRTPGNGTALMSITLPQAVETADRGILEAGNYYFSSEQGFMSQAMFEQTDNYFETLSLDEVDLNTEAQRVVEVVLAVREAVHQYHNDLGLFPGAYETPIILGLDGVTALHKHSGFYPSTINNDPAYIRNIRSGSPTTDIVYDSALGRTSYLITYTLLGNAEKYESGMYEATPHAIKRIGPAPQM